jgi:hypothetical protein
MGLKEVVTRYWGRQEVSDCDIRLLFGFRSDSIIIIPPLSMYVFLRHVHNQAV